MVNDLRYALRAVLRAPAFALLGACTLALGIGANTAIFSVINGVLLKPLPYRDADRIARLSEGRPGFELNVSYLNFLDWRMRSRTFEDMAVHNPYGRAIVATGGQAESVAAGTAESRLFALLGVQPIRGRLFTHEEESKGNAVLISYRLWLRRFGGSDAVIGQSLNIWAAPSTVVGVLPPWFRLQNIDVWSPLPATIGPMQLDRANHPGFQVFGRLRNGADFARAQQEMSSIASDLERQYPISNIRWASSFDLSPRRLSDACDRCCRCSAAPWGFCS
jgi:putative ABC transport system permease protein